VLMAQIVHWLGTGFGPFGAPGFLSQAVAFPFGLIAAGLVVRRPAAGGAWPAGLAAIALFVFMVAGLPLWHLPDRVFVYHGQFAALAGLLCVLLHGTPVPILVNAVTIWIGRVSFGIYLFHFALFAPVLAAARLLVGDAGDVALLALYYPLLVLAATAVASLTHVAIELPGIRLGRRVIAWRRARVLSPA
jgi:peptidoglycan/LPS O-acetylase OafA/YrhL